MHRHTRGGVHSSDIWNWINLSQVQPGRIIRFTLKSIYYAYPTILSPYLINLKFTFGHTNKEALCMIQSNWNQPQLKFNLQITDEQFHHFHKGWRVSRSYQVIKFLSPSLPTSKFNPSPPKFNLSSPQLLYEKVSISKPLLQQKESLPSKLTRLTTNPLSCTN